jgi:uncharacterized protein
VLSVRLAVAVLAAVLLYRALGQEGQGWGGGAASVARRFFFALLGALVFFSLTARWVPEQRAPEAGRGFQAYVQAMLTHRFSYTTLAGTALGREDAAVPAEERVVRWLQTAVESIPESVYFRRYLGIAQAERGDYAAARETLEAAMELLERRAPGRARVERQVWLMLYGPDLPRPRQIDTARETLEGFGFGWLARVAALAAYERLGPEAVPAELRRRVSGEAGRYVQRLASGAVVPLLLLPQLGLIVLVVGIVLIQTGVLRKVERPHHPVGPALWESFILMLALGMVPVLWLFGGQRPSPETQPGAFATLLVASDLLQLGALVYLWLRLRGRGLTLAEIGLTGRRLPTELLIGVAAAAVMIPSAHLIGILTQALSDRLFPSIAPPYHPLSGMTATTASPEIRAALFFAAVIGAPFLEEIFFRGALYGALRRRFGIWPGILASSAFFAILHPQLPLGFLPLVWLAVCFALLYEWRQSLVAAMAAHALYNGLAFLMLTLLFPAGG